MPMLQRLRAALIVVASLTAGATTAQTQQQVVDVPTRPGVTDRLLVLMPPTPKAAVILLPGGHGGLQMQPEGSIRWGDNNFLVRTRQLFADQGLMVALMDAPSDRQLPPYLGGFRQTPEHVSDLKAELIAETGGFTRGDPCEAQSYHGFSGVESKVVQQIAAWISK